MHNGMMKASSRKSSFQQDYLVGTWEIALTIAATLERDGQLHELGLVGVDGGVPREISEREVSVDTIV